MNSQKLYSLTESNPLLDEILIVIVLYKQSLTACESFKSLQMAIGRSRATLYAHDNSPSACVIPPSDFIEVNYHHDPSNPGVSKAYNEGHKMAIRLKKKWLLLADQDTTFPSTIFSYYKQAVHDYPQHRVFVPSLHDSSGPLSPFRLIWGKGRRVRRFLRLIQSFKKFKFINSGLLVSAEAFERANGYDERFPLDYSDISFCDRLSIHDPNFVLVPAQCHHNFSATSAREDLSTEIIRFKSFCKAVQLYKKISSQFVSLSWTILPRALKLSIERRSLAFIKIGIEHTLRNI